MRTQTQVRPFLLPTTLSSFTKILSACWSMASLNGLTFGWPSAMRLTVVVPAKNVKHGGNTWQKSQLTALKRNGCLSSLMLMLGRANQMALLYSVRSAIDCKYKTRHFAFPAPRLVMSEIRPHVFFILYHFSSVCSCLSSYCWLEICFRSKPLRSRVLIKFSEWRTPDRLSGHTIDYVAIPRHCVHECELSRVVEELDLGNSHHDHQAVAVQLHWHENKFTGPAPPRTKALIDINQLQRHHVFDALLAHDVPPWQTDIEQQVNAFNHHILQELAKTCPAKRQAPKKPGIDSATWDLRIQKLAARRGLKEIACRRRRELLRFCLTSWKKPTQDLQHRFWQYDGWLMCLNVKLFGRFQLSAQRLKASLKSARPGTCNRPLINYIQTHLRPPSCMSSRRSLVLRTYEPSSSRPCR